MITVLVVVQKWMVIIMAEYIDREALYEIFEDKMQDDNIMCPVITVLSVLDIIENQPSADVQEIKHGYWIEQKKRHTTSSGGTGTTPYRECSVCGWDYPVITVGQHFKLYKCCPECGAKMDKENK